MPARPDWRCASGLADGPVVVVREGDAELSVTLVDHGRLDLSDRANGLSACAAIRSHNPAVDAANGTYYNVIQIWKHYSRICTV
jgi:hypothetical protein